MLVPRCEGTRRSRFIAASAVDVDRTQILTRLKTLHDWFGAALVKYEQGRRQARHVE
jgi:hypothetical protein